MAITLTEKAAERMSDYLANRGTGVGVRLSVQTTGCLWSWLQYGVC